VAVGVRHKSFQSWPSECWTWRLGRVECARNWRSVHVPAGNGELPA
jgi:hypothetical protein